MASGFAEIQAALAAAGWQVHVPGVDLEPGLVAAHPTKGVLALDVGEVGDEARKDLNRKVVTLRDAVPELEFAEISRRLLAPEEAGDMAWIGELPDRALQDGVLEALTTLFDPTITVVLPRRHPLRDDLATDRAARRLVLDAEQSHVARRDVTGVLLVKGSPGSGKTLVLAARAIWLALQNPCWDIRLLCYNRVLVPYLEELVAGHPAISVQTFGGFAHSIGAHVSLIDEETASRDVDRFLRSGRVYRLVDGLLIDEWQDFSPAWTRLALEVLKPGRGGAVFASDPRQALYRESTDKVEFKIHDAEEITLGRSYRSTKQILEVTAAMEPEDEGPNLDYALDGPPVDLVWTEKESGQAACVAREVRLLLASGARAPEDVGILVTRRFAMAGLERALLAEGVPCRRVYPNQASELNLAEPSVKITTVHSAKGLEFDVVFLVGIEHLPNPDGSVGNERQARAGYVGATRARDQLVMTYSKVNIYLERVRSLPNDLLRRWAWPDDYPEV